MKKYIFFLSMALLFVLSVWAGFLKNPLLEMGLCIVAAGAVCVRSTKGFKGLSTVEQLAVLVMFILQMYISELSEHHLAAMFLAGAVISLTGLLIFKRYDLTQLPVMAVGTYMLWYAITPAVGQWISAGVDIRFGLTAMDTTLEVIALWAGAVLAQSVIQLLSKREFGGFDAFFEQISHFFTVYYLIILFYFCFIYKPAFVYDAANWMPLVNLTAHPEPGVWLAHPLMLGLPAGFYYAVLRRRPCLYKTLLYPAVTLLVFETIRHLFQVNVFDIDVIIFGEMFFLTGVGFKRWADKLAAGRMPGDTIFTLKKNETMEGQSDA